MQDRPGGDVFAVGKALFVIPKESNPLKKQNGIEESGWFGKKEALVTTT